jgi:hypothetical protein
MHRNKATLQAVTPVCECTPEMHLQFEDGSAIVVSVSSEFLDNTPIGAAAKLAGLRDSEALLYKRTGRETKLV